MWGRLTRLGFVLSELESIDVVWKEERWCFVALTVVTAVRHAPILDMNEAHDALSHNHDSAAWTTQVGVFATPSH